jgi:hypothetical protein
MRNQRFRNYSTVSLTVSAMQKNVQETFRNFSPIPPTTNRSTDIVGVSWEV